MAKVTYIIPLHKFDESVEKFLPRALKSIKDIKSKDYSIIIVGPSSVTEKTNGIVSELKLKTSVKYVDNEGDTDFFSQVNAAALMCTTKFFCVVEYDDQVMEYWQDCAERYWKETEASVLLPLDEYVNTDGQWESFGNEIAWGGAFSNEVGYIDIDGLNTYMDFNVTGAFIKTEDFISVGCLKPSLKIAAWYEFLLRMCHNGKKVYVVPKLGYSHVLGREGSYSSEMRGDISQEEGRWLIETAKQEYFFKEDRKKKFGE
jgi:hypothetical protein